MLRWKLKKKKTEGEVYRLLPNKVKIFKVLVSQNKEIYRWLLINGINKTDVNGIKAKGFDATLSKDGWAKGTLLVPNINEPQTSLLYLPSLKNIYP